MNKADSERLESALDRIGLRSNASAEDADVVVLNSCVVRQSAEDRVVGMLGSLKHARRENPDKIIALMGCMVGPRTTPLETRFPHVNVFMRPQQYEPLIDMLAERMGFDPEGCLAQLTARPAVTAYVPIVHGCDKFCSFCIIPYRRGREVSRTVEDVVREVTMLVERGVQEVTLLGQNVDSYGHDLPGEQDLGKLLRAVDKVDGIERVRFLTSHPNDMSDGILDAVAECETVCEHVNLPFQAGDDQVLRDMRRGYTNEEYRVLVDRIRDRIPGVSLSTDLIVGFCGETDAQFQRTLDMVRDIRFDKVHSAAYSARGGHDRRPKAGGRRSRAGQEGAPEGHRQPPGGHPDRDQRAALRADYRRARRGEEQRSRPGPQPERQAGVRRRRRRSYRRGSGSQDRPHRPVVSRRVRGNRSVGQEGRYGGPA